MCGARQALRRPLLGGSLRRGRRGRGRRGRGPTAAYAARTGEPGLFVRAGLRVGFRKKGFEKGFFVAGPAQRRLRPRHRPCMRLDPARPALPWRLQAHCTGTFPHPSRPHNNTLTRHRHVTRSHVPNRFTQPQALSELAGLLLVGTEPVGLTLGWALACLAAHKPVQVWVWTAPLARHALSPPTPFRHPRPFVSPTRAGQAGGGAEARGCGGAWAGVARVRRGLG
jgi:hypothetical protein